MHRIANIKSTRALIIVMCALVVIAYVIANNYYSKKNNSIDPRIKDARILYERYNVFAEAEKYDSVFYLLDTIESIYKGYEHYKNSFEVGVLYNNRAALYLSQALALETDSVTIELKDSLILMAEKATLKSISLYDSWLDRYKTFSKNNDDILLEDDFFVGLETLDKKVNTRIVNQRKKEIKDALIETNRRLSVSYTNLGVIYRHKQEYMQAAHYYKKAIELWDKNLTAENNLNVLLNRPIKERNIIQKMFPPERITN